MKKLFILAFIAFGHLLVAQNLDVNTKKGFAVEGYDVVSYFNNSVKKGNKSFVSIHNGISYKFSSEKNLNTFKSNPEKYIPQYGGYCAYAVAVKGKKVSINPETYEIRNGKLYLFYNAWVTNTLALWNKESPEKLVSKADANWKTITQ